MERSTWVEWSLILILLCIAFGAGDVYGYPAGAAVLRDADGQPIKVGSATPYSPKQTCTYGGVNGINCHIDMIKSYGLSSGTIYESHIAYALHDHGPGTGAYSVPYPVHGVAAAYRVQQGRNIPWGDLQRAFYKTFGSVSSAGMFGLYSSTYARQLADLNASSPLHFDMSAYDFAHSECALCHVGGGPMEYDREGYRYDGSTGLFQSGFNPDPKRGDYYSFDENSGMIVSRSAEWGEGGVAEIDCLMCHMTRTFPTYALTQAQCIAAGGTWKSDYYGYYCSLPLRYSLLERNYALLEGKSPRLAASLGLTGTSSLNALLGISRKGADGVNPDISQSAWSWTGNSVVNSDEVYFDAIVASVPPKENCALCHYVDKSDLSPGPAGEPIGYTVFQKIIPAGTTDDGDKIGGGTNDTQWADVIYRDSSRKNGESINDPLNPDAHMDKGRVCSFCHYTLGTARDYSGDCVTCHYDFWGYPAPPAVIPVAPQMFPAVTDSNGNVVQPAVPVFKLDHQFAKGNNKPYGVNMDQLDNTVTCEGCHTERTHPNAAAAPDPAAAHAGFPAFHFDKVDCRVCHTGGLNSPIKQVLADYTAGPYQGGARSQYLSDPAGIRYRPLYIYRATGVDGSGIKIKAVSLLVASAWVDGDASKPIFQRIVKAAAEDRRDASGDADGDGVSDWPLNRPQGGDTSLIINTQGEINDMVGRLQAKGVATPIMNFYIDAYNVSHNIATKASGKTLGSPAGGGCVMCHSSDDPASPNYSTKSVGFFSKTFTLFNQPSEGGQGLVQTEVGGIKRVNIKFPTIYRTGAPHLIDLSGNNGDTVGNTLNQGEVLGFDAYTLSIYQSPSAGNIATPVVSFNWSSDAAVSYKVNFDASGSTCQGGCSYAWDFDSDGVTDSTSAIASYTYAAAGSYPVKLTVNDVAYGFIRTASKTVEAKQGMTAPVASRTITQNGWDVVVVDSSTDAEDAQSALTVTVDWGNGTTSSGPAGTTFTKTYTVAGSYTIKHMVKDTGNLTTSSANQTLSVPQKYSVSGTILRANGTTPLSGVWVYLKQGGANKYLGVTNSLGSYTVSNVVPGTYDVVPVKSGYTFTPATRSVTVGPNATGINFNSNQ